MNIVVKITPNEKGNPPGKLADAELHFIDGELDGLKDRKSTRLNSSHGMSSRMPSSA